MLAALLACAGPDMSVAEQLHTLMERLMRPLAASMPSTWQRTVSPSRTTDSGMDTRCQLSSDLCTRPCTAACSIAPG